LCQLCAQDHGQQPLRILDNNPESDKGAKDAKRGALFSKLSKKITLAAKAGGSPDPKLNFQLAREVEIAKREGLPYHPIK
jgi:transcriptional/translational regulatory protein YebC/TACO1